MDQRTTVCRLLDSAFLAARARMVVLLGRQRHRERIASSYLLVCMKIAGMEGRMGGIIGRLEQWHGSDFHEDAMWAQEEIMSLRAAIAAEKAAKEAAIDYANKRERPLLGDIAILKSQLAAEKERAEKAERERDAIGESLRERARYQGIAERDADSAEKERDAAIARAEAAEAECEALRKRQIVYSPDAKAMSDRVEAAEALLREAVGAIEAHADDFAYPATSRILASIEAHLGTKND